MICRWTEAYPAYIHGVKFDKAYLISLERSPERKRRFDRYAQRAGLEVEWFPAIYGLDVDIEDYRSRGYIADNFELRMAGSLGTLLSHVHVWEKIQADPDCQVGLIFEDDATFGKHFVQQVEDIPTELLPEDWDMFWLGWHKLDCEPINDLIGKPRPDCKRGTNSGHFAYMVRSDSVDKLKELLIPYNNRSSKDVILRKNFDRFKAYFLLKRISKTPTVEFDSVRKNINNPDRTKKFSKWLGQKVSRLRYLR